jgi:SanA protein
VRRRKLQLIIQRLTLLGSIIGMLFVIPQAWITLAFRPQIFTAVETVPTQEYAVVFGAQVYADFSLSDVTRERIEAAIQLYEQKKVQKIFISGDNRHNQEAEAIAWYAEQKGIPTQAIMIDRLGIDTHDTCRHFAQLASKAVLVTQEFHLPRAMYLCEQEGIQVTGLAVNRLNIIQVRGSNPIEIYTIRTTRYIREAGLTWAYVLGLYDPFSNEAEQLEH